MRAANLLVVGIPDTDLDGDTRKRLEALRPGAVLLLPRNVEDMEQLVELVGEIREQLPESLLAIDVEGGRVDTLQAVMGGAPSPADLAAGSASLALETGRWVGHALRLFDVDFDLAPVVDVDRGEENNALDGRYLGTDPEQVLVRARAFLRGLHTAGIGGCLKHFPGLGGATDDTHLMGSSVYLPREELERDLEPFRELGELAGAVMVGHANYPAFDRDGLPATLSPRILRELLRDEVGFAGIAVSDDLEMKALDDWGDTPERAQAAFLAGCDLLVVPHSLEAAEAIAERLDTPRFEARREEAGARLRGFREHLQALGVRHEQELLDSGQRRGYDLDLVQEKLAVLREAATKARDAAPSS